MESRTHTLGTGETLVASGYFRGDIGLNDSDLTVTITGNRTFKCKIEPFTKNCGIKAISYPRGDPTLVPVLESFLFHVCRSGIVVGSDHTHGSTFKFLKSLGYISTDPVWNPVYTWESGRNHKISLFYKFLGHLEGENNPWPDWRASNA